MLAMKGTKARNSRIFFYSIHSGFSHALNQDTLANCNRHLKRKNGFLKNAHFFMKQLYPLKYFLFTKKQKFYKTWCDHVTIPVPNFD